MVAAALDVDGAQVVDPGEAPGVHERRRARGGSASPGRGTWKSTLRRESSICSSLRYWCPAPRLGEIGDPDLVEQAGVAEHGGERDHERHRAVTLADADALRREGGQLLRRVRPAGTDGSKTPWTMLCAR